MNLRILILVVFAALAAGSLYFATKLKFAFSFEQFFPQGDEDLEYFQEFIQHFETDDNFLLIAVRRKQGVFEQQFLQQFHDFTLKSRELPHVRQSISLTKFGYPVKTPFAITTVPAIHVDQPALYESDRQRLLQDERFVHNLISEDGTALIIYLKLVDAIQLEQAKELMQALTKLAESYDFDSYHLLGRPFFQTQLVEMEMEEVSKSAVISGILVSIIFFFIFRRFWGVVIANVSILMGMLLFVGYLGAFGRELSAMSALYPILMIIVGTSDIVHFMSKYVDELRWGKTRRDAMWITIKEIGLATFVTAATTAVGFASLLTNKVVPIRDFGINAAVGVLIAYVTTLFFSSALMSCFRVEQITRFTQEQASWERAMLWLHGFTKRHPRGIAWSAVAATAVCTLGISLITTNYEVMNNLPGNSKIREDFIFFEKNISGFRPMELAGYVQPGYQADDFAVVKELDKLEQHLKQYPAIQAINSVTTVYKSINQMYAGNRPEAYRLPEDSVRFAEYRRVAAKIPQLSLNVLTSKDGSKVRVTSRVQDIGADSIQRIEQNIRTWMTHQMDSNVVRFKITGTGLLMDKNARYIRGNLLQGLAISVVIIGVMMALLFLNWRFLIIAMIPNFIPLFIAGAFLGFTGIELEAGISIIFSIVFGIAADDTIHVLGKFKLERQKGRAVEDALRVTMIETCKPVTFTTLILFFGFLVMLFSEHPPSFNAGWLIAVTLASGLACETFLMPVLIRWLIKDKEKSKVGSPKPEVVEVI
jgi:hypothetical protein